MMMMNVSGKFLRKRVGDGTLALMPIDGRIV
jgi:hypothetical protein